NFLWLPPRNRTTLRQGNRLRRSSIVVSTMSKVFVIPVVPGGPKRPKLPRHGDRKYIESQRLIVEAMRDLPKDAPQGNRLAIELLSERFRTQFRMTDRPEQPN